MLGQIRVDLFLVPDVISRSQNGNPHVKQFFHQRGRDAEAGGGVFAVGQHQIRLADSQQGRE